MDNEKNFKQELTPDMLDNVVGGVNRTINTGCSDKAAVRQGPGTGNRQVAALMNGTIVDTIGNPVYDSVSGRNFVQIRYTDKYGKAQIGWVAASLVGLPR